MKGHRKKGKSTLHEEEEALTESELAFLVQAFAEDLQERAHSDLEPFESYLYQHRLKWCKDLTHCSERIGAGFRSILKESSSP